jgi:N-sulfoglucosamine sulfohydrolase
MKRRTFIRNATTASCALIAGQFLNCSRQIQDSRPNILFAVSDDQTWQYFNKSKSNFLQTPNFDRVANQGVLFKNAFCSAPQCSPCRASILTGRNIWQLEEAGTHGSNFPQKFPVYTELLRKSGYFVGFTGKGWAPGNWEISGWKNNPAGVEFNKFKSKETPTKFISDINYSKNFEDFLNHRPEGKPFCFWYGGFEPHREYEEGSGIKAGKNPEDVKVPSFLPNTPEVKSDILDYALEIEWFDKHLGLMLDQLEKSGELENTLLTVTSDNGMPFPRAKANNYEFGTHMPLAISWPAKVPGGRFVEDLISFIDFAPTFLEAAGSEIPSDVTGKSLLPLLLSNKKGLIDPNRDRIYNGRERHTHARPDNLGYPIRAVRTEKYLYIRNFKPERWPAGNPPADEILNSKSHSRGEGYYDIDGSPTKTFMINNKKKYKDLFNAAFAKRPAEELYDIVVDPECINNLVNNKNMKEIKSRLSNELERVLTEQGDPRMLGYGDIFESYPRYMKMRQFPGFKEEGKYNLKYTISK